MGPGYHSLWVHAGDGLKLHARDYGPAVSPHPPVICLPGLARHSGDFHDLALALSGGEKPRRVLALDYRGRGLSAHDTDARRYSVAVETDDVVQVLTAAGIGRSIFVGTSRGGLIAMAIAAQRPILMAAAILNDIGPVIELRGLVRIKGYVGKMPVPATFEQGTEILRSLFDQQFPALEADDWRALADGTWRESEGRLVLAYDPALMEALAEIDPEVPITPLWPLFEALKVVPVLTLRGAHSDLLSAETLAEMARVHPSFEAITVPGQGHAPLLRGRDVIAPITAFIEAVERRKSG